MGTRTIYLISARNITFQPANFSILRERNQGPRRQRSYGRLSLSIQTKLQPNASHIIDSSADAPPRIDPTPRGNIELAAAEVPTPGISQNFMAPISNKRCQEWTMEYIRHLVARGIVGKEAIDIVQSKMDLPSHGIGLQWSN
ncbi:hypothetical protein PENARI_c023G01958 [Penicillium arizonense]|uniref:Uncharacterized protein n=1 Tax=Penicillium arizonense TaxID=1835702 RepID=A0A1F5L789_PENAI|nr:hypothetical protein PENARI_c023G01958 [Penicillium arizonense]OGE49094.1 hypothetical protein PENARI_c023G01958 [Penicillium arizonense]